MKTFIQTLLITLSLLLGISHLHAQGTAFRYQGRLDADGGTANGSFDFRFRLASDAFGSNFVGSPLLTDAVPVSNGLFTVTLDFGAGVFTGGNFWVQVGVKTNGAGSYTTLAPLQAITSTPYAITASNLSGTLPAAQLSGTIASANLAGTYSSALTVNNAANSFSGSGAGLTALNAGELSGGTVPDARLAVNMARTNQVWLLGGNAGTTPGTHFFGTTDDRSLELRVNGTRALRLEPNAASPNVIGGYVSNSVSPGFIGATIAGGGREGLVHTISANHGTIGGGDRNAVSGEDGTIAGGGGNVVAGNYASVGGGLFNYNFAYVGTIAGGRSNTIQFYSEAAAIGGGYFNTIQPDAQYATIGGGYFNTIQTSALYATIGGGVQNTIQNNGTKATIAGGYFNTIQPYADVATIGGGYANTIQFNAQRATISGGDFNTIQPNAFSATIGGGTLNTIQINSRWAIIGGGYQNTIQTNGGYATIGGGYANAIEPNASGNDSYATIAGGGVNTIQSNAFEATIGGGFLNTIQTNAQRATIGGGFFNLIQANAASATIGGGTQNTIQPDAQYATIPGGYSNSAASYAFAAGRRAKANHQGSFVWADVTDADFASTAINQFNIRAAGGVRLSDSTPQLSFGQTVRQMITLYDSGVNSTFGIGVQGSTFYQRAGTGSGFAWYSGGTHNNAQTNSGGGLTLMTLDNAGLTVRGTFVSSSDRNVKENFASVQPREMLEKVVTLPLSSWNYKADTATRHIGPMAQDFYAAFGVGTDDKHIATVDADGVALAAIQGLNQKVEEKEVRIGVLEKELSELKQAVKALLERKQ